MKISTIMNLLDGKYPNAYAEHGLNVSGKQIVVADWNDVPRFIGDYLEDKGIELGWCDMYHSCTDCGVYLDTESTSPDDHIYLECELLCEKCATDCCGDVVEYVANNPRRALPTWWDVASLEADGWVLRNGVDNPYLNGVYGPSAKPQDVIRDTVKDGQEYVFALDFAHPFELGFNIYTRELS